LIDWNCKKIKILAISRPARNGGGGMSFTLRQFIIAAVTQGCVEKFARRDIPGWKVLEGAGDSALLGEG